MTGTNRQLSFQLQKMNNRSCTTFFRTKFKHVNPAFVVWYTIMVMKSILALGNRGNQENMTFVISD